MRAILLVLLLSGSAVCQQGGWKLVWADEFNTPGAPDPKNWVFEKGFVRNQELQWYRPDNARCENGLLIIEGRREELPNPLWKADGKDWRSSRKTIQYTSSSLMTKGLHQWQYGRFEMRGRIDTRPGLWPAFWTLGASGEWPSNGEIDIMEYYRGVLLANAAWGTDKRFTAAWSTTKKPLTTFSDPEWSSKFHLWRMDWDPDFIRLYVDGILLNTVDLSKTINKDGTNPFHRPHYVLLNLAIGGQSGGDPSGTNFPAKFEVDYVRIYEQTQESADAAKRLRALIAGSPRAPFQPVTVSIKPPQPDWNTDYISSVAAGRNGVFYVLHRNLKYDPLLVVDRQGNVLRSWGRGMFTNPHSVRVDPEGNVWTVDSGSSVVMKFSPEGKQLLRFEVGEVPQGQSGFRGTSDIAFGPQGRLFISDGYGNARILEYDGKGHRVRQWGSHGTGPGEFHLPHSIAVRDGVIYVADRENGRIQRFDLNGKYLGEWDHLGKTFSISIASDGNLWIGTHPRNVSNEAPGWLVNVDKNSGKVIGYVDSPGLHSVSITPEGDVIADPGRGNLNRLLWLRPSH